MPVMGKERASKFGGVCPRTVRRSCPKLCSAIFSPPSSPTACNAHRARFADVEGK